ncbi:MAG: hypothetical protein NTZ09_19405 [Candidatus Hydrogenedentes bacterium]|nr:hypothetical protein [Candidatus Hydrogenedentota bacterium]
MSNPVNIPDVRDAMVAMVDAMNADLAAAIEQANAEPGNTSAMFELQYEMQRWSIGVQAETNVIKTLGDTLKSVIQNLR